MKMVVGTMALRLSYSSPVQAHKDPRVRRERLAKKEPKAIRAHQAQWGQKAIRAHQVWPVPQAPQVFGS